MSVGRSRPYGRQCTSPGGLVPRRQRSELDRNATDMFIASPEQRPRSVATGMAAMATTPKAAERYEGAPILLQMMKDPVLSPREKIGVWQHNARRVSARSMGDTFLTLRLRDVHLTSKADPVRKATGLKSLADPHVAHGTTVARRMDQKRSEAPDDGRLLRGDN